VVLVVRDLSSVPVDVRGAVVTIGAYDGVHRGHRAVIAEVRRIAAERGVPSAVVTFDRHPAQVVRPASAPQLLVDLEQKLELLETTGVDAVIVVPFDEERSTESAEDFVAEILVGAIGTSAIVVGEDFHFGKGRGGSVALLQQMGPENGFEVVGLSLLGAQDIAMASHKVSSTAVRELLRAGEVAQARVLLGRPHEVRGHVVGGDQRGRTLGFPTANVKLPTDICLPADGIYAGWYIRPDHVALPAAINLGRRPTFYDDQPYSLLEAFVIDWSGDLYGEPARVQFVQRLRAELKFDGIDSLVAQMQRDVAKAREILSI
jgi:riboflavin kinase / FMN adenylyltransferase